MIRRVSRLRNFIDWIVGTALGWAFTLLLIALGALIGKIVFDDDWRGIAGCAIAGLSLSVVLLSQFWSNP